jgi:flagellar biosynthesis protein FliR
MNDLWEQLAADPWGRLVLQYLVTSGMENCLLYLLIASRLCGIFVVAPFFSANSLVSLPIRIGLVVLLSMIIVPTVSRNSAPDGQAILVANLTLLINTRSEIPTDLMALIAGELALGSMLGIGALAVFSGLRLGGEWIDRHSGLGLGTILNPDWSGRETASLRLIPIFGFAVFLLMEPLSGQWLLLRSLIESFHAIPPGEATCCGVTIGLMNSLVQQSLVLGIRIAIPLVVVMLIVDITFAFASRTAHFPVSAFAVASKAAIGICVLALTLTAIPEVIATTILSLFS